MKKILNVLFVVLTLTALTMVTGCPDDDGEDSEKGDVKGSTSNTPILLTENVWADGNIASSSGVQWFKFTATDATQYIYVNLGTLTNLNVQLYDNDNNTVGSVVNFYNSNISVSQTLTLGQVYSIKVTPNSGNGKYQITFSKSAIAPAITLTINVWANGYLAPTGSEQWFKFTATATTHYILFNQGNLSEIYVQLYKENGIDTVGSQSSLSRINDSATKSSLTIGEVYLIKVSQQYSYINGTYQITFSTSSTTLINPATILPSNAIQLTENYWRDGYLPTLNDEQWFKFTATATPQYIYASFGSLKDFYVQLYDSDGKKVNNQTNLYGSTNYTTRSVTVGKEYYIKATSNKSDGNTYQIGFTSSTTTPLKIALPTSPTALTKGIWADSNINVEDGARWFKFTATDDPQYIHVNFGTLTGIIIEAYYSTGYLAGSQTIYNSTTNKYISISPTVGKECYIKVTSSSSTNVGTYKIAYNDSSTTPTVIKLPSDATQLTFNTFANGNTTSGEAQWFKFTATADKQYIQAGLGTGFGTLDAYYGVYIQVYDSNNGYGDNVGAQTRLSGSTKSSFQALNEGQEYYIKVWRYNSSSNGTYQIAFNSTLTPPNIAITTLNTNTWTDGNIPKSNGEQWFKFTATKNVQYIVVNFGAANNTLSSLAIQLYDYSGNTLDSRPNLSINNKFTSWTTLSAGQEYYIKASSSNSGNYQIAFNWLPTPLDTNITTITSANTWTNGNIPTSNGEQWFKFTANAATQFIYASIGTLDSLYVQLYDDSGNAVDYQTQLSSSTKYTSRTLTVNNTYYIKVWPYSSTGAGNYKIAFGINSTPPSP